MHILEMKPMNPTPATTAFQSNQTPARGFTRRGLSLFIVSLGLAVAGCSPAVQSGDSVSLETARAEHEAGQVTMIDIREPLEHATGVAQGAQLLPMQQLNARLSEIPTSKDKPVYLICNTQNRSSATLTALRERGYSHVKYVQGGMSEWARRGWPMVKPPR